MSGETHTMQFTEFQRQLVWLAMNELGKELNVERDDLVREYNAIMQQLTGTNS
jgi:hypothetical protein